MDMSQYRELFVSECRGHLNAFNEMIMRLEEDASDQAAIDEIFRHAHSVKGMAATMQFDAVTLLAHSLEDLLSRIRNREQVFSTDSADLLLEGSDLLAAMVDRIENGAGEDPDPSDLIRRLSADPAGIEPEPAPEARLEISDAPALPDAAGESGGEDFRFRQSDSFKSVRVRTEILDRLVNITGELITTRHHLAEQVNLHPEAGFEEPVSRLSLLLRELRDEVFQARMLPFAVAAERLPRLVRDLSRKQGKEAVLQIEGKEIELDRGILEEIIDPLVHLLRNAVDHGLESPDERAASDKPPAGTIVVEVVRKKGQIDVAVRDDGRGIDPRKIVAKALERGFITAQDAEELSPQAARMLICTPGFSTASGVTDVSGRGVGMDAVRNAMHNLGGALGIDSEVGAGSCFTMSLPVSVSIIHALLVECGRLTVALPVSGVIRTVELCRSDIIDENGRKGVELDGDIVPVRSLNRLLGQELTTGLGSLVPAVVVNTGGDPAVLLADRIIGQREVFIKPLGAPLGRMRGLAGGTIAGDGRIVFVIDPGSLM